MCICVHIMHTIFYQNFLACFYVDYIIWGRGRDVISCAMSKFKTTLDSSNCLGLLREVSIGSQKYLCFTRFSEADAQWLIR